MTTRAKRMIKYLENELGWTVYSISLTCKNEHQQGFGAKNYCTECGEKLTKKHDTESVKEVEAAIKYALNEK
jgi:hypothetical protein